MALQHSDLASGRWHELSLFEQMGNIGSETNRALRSQKTDKQLFENSIFRALELLDFTIADPRWRKRLKELTRAREVLCDAYLGGKEYKSTLEDIDTYFFQFALAARLQR